MHPETSCPCHGCLRSGRPWVLNPMTSVLIRDKDESDTKARPCARGGTDWATQPQAKERPRCWGRQEGPPEPLEGARLADTVILDVKPPELEGNAFC